MKKNVFFAGMVLAFGLVLMGCPQEVPDSPSISISGTPKVGEILTATVNGDTGSSEVLWQAFNDAACTNIFETGGSYGGVPLIHLGTSITLSASVEGKWIRAYVEDKGHDKFYSNILGPVVEADPAPLDPLTDVTLTPATASVNKGNTQAFELKFKQGASFNSSDITWSVVGATAAGTTITGSGVSMDGTYTKQNRTLTVASGETATTLTVKVVYGTQEWTATVTVTP